MAILAKLPAEAQQMPITALYPSTKNMLAEALDQPRSTPTSKGVTPDWRGLAWLTNTNPNTEAKTKGILQNWSPDRGANVRQLLRYLEELERTDILENARLFARLESDYAAYEDRGQDSDHQDSIRRKDEAFDQYSMITRDDIERKGKPKLIYDAYVSHCTEDMSFVLDLIQMVEVELGLRLFIPDRDLLPGVSIHYVSANIIGHRCRKFLAVMSPEYLQSSECEFQVKVCLSISPSARQKILIPVMYRQCEMPDAIKFITMLDYTKREQADWFSSKLSAVLRTGQARTLSNLLTQSEQRKLDNVRPELLPDDPPGAGDTSPARRVAPTFMGQRGARRPADDDYHDNDDDDDDDEDIRYDSSPIHDTSVMKAPMASPYYPRPHGYNTTNVVHAVVPYGGNHYPTLPLPVTGFYESHPGAYPPAYHSYIPPPSYKSTDFDCVPITRANEQDNESTVPRSNNGTGQANRTCRDVCEQEDESHPQCKENTVGKAFKRMYRKIKSSFRRKKSQSTTSDPRHLSDSENDSRHLSDSGNDSREVSSSATDAPVCATCTPVAPVCATCTPVAPDRAHAHTTAPVYGQAPHVCAFEHGYSLQSGDIVISRDNTPIRSEQARTCPDLDRSLERRGSNEYQLDSLSLTDIQIKS